MRKTTTGERRSSHVFSHALACALPFITASAHAQQTVRSTTALDEIIVTATRVETNLQQTPMSVQALSGAELDLRGIDAGRDLGIMVPNVVLNPGPVGELGGTAIIRGLPGVTTYVDGFSIGNGGFLQRSYVELERVEVLRGPQGTLFGRNSNGGAVQIFTRPPGEEFAIRVSAEVGELERQTLKFAADVPLSDRLLTKWTVASDRSDGFMPSRTAAFSLGDENNTLARADMLWRPTDRFSLRLNVNEEESEGSPARILRVTNPQHTDYIAYNVLAGSLDFLNQARAIDPAFPDPPFPLATDRFTPETHEQGFPGGELGRWETRSDTVGPTIVDHRYAMLALEWDVTDRFTLESLTAFLDTESLQNGAYDGSEFDMVSELPRDQVRAQTQELHLIGQHFNGRLESLLGLYYDDSEIWRRFQSWLRWEFVIPSTGPSPGTPGPPGVGGRPAWNPAAVGYVRAWGATVGSAAVAAFAPATFFAADRLFYSSATDRAIFGQFKIGLTEKLDLTLGFRYTGHDGADAEYVPAEAFRSAEPEVITPGNPFAPGTLITGADRPDFGTVSTPKAALSYRATDDVYVYASYAEGFTSAAVVNILALPEPIRLDPEVVESRELGVRSDWLEHRLRLNATYFDARWDGLRVPKRVDIDASTSIFVPSSAGLAHTEGLEAEISYLLGDRWQIDLAVGLLDSEYLDIGVPPANGSGLQPGIPFAYAPEQSFSFGLRYRLPLANGSEILVAGNYGWMDEYQRTATNDTQPKNPDGSSKPEPAYGMLNARIDYRLANRDWHVSLFGTNLTNEWYVNGGFDAGTIGGFDHGTIGRPRELGVGVRFAFD